METLVPKQIDLEVTSACNLKCKYCPAWTEKGQANVQHMEAKFYKSIIDRVVKEGFKTVIVAWLNGEPLLHPDYAELIKYTTDAKLPVYITTNGMIWDDELFEHITEENSCYQIIFSLDGIHDETIKKARPGTDVINVLNTINRFRDLKINKGNNIDMCVKICRRGQDYQEIEEYIIKWLQVEGIDFVCVGSPLIDDKGGIRHYPCQYSDNNFMVVKSDQYVTFCAYNDEMTNNRDNAVGKLDYDTPILEFYNNEKYTKFREAQRKGDFHKVCKTCGFSYTGQGFEGKIKFRTWHEELFYHQDYYNQFFSKVQKWKDKDYYKMGSHL